MFSFSFQQMQQASNDVLFCIARMLDGRSLACLSSTDRRAHRVIDQSCRVVWRELWWKRYGRHLVLPSPEEKGKGKGKGKDDYRCAWILEQSAHTRARQKIIDTRVQENRELRRSIWFEVVESVNAWACPFIQALAWTCSAWLCYSHNELSWETLWALAAAAACTFLMRMMALGNENYYRRRTYLVDCASDCVFCLFFISWLASPTLFPLWLVPLPVFVRYRQDFERINLFRITLIHCCILALAVWIGSWTFASMRLLVVFWLLVVVVYVLPWSTCTKLDDMFIYLAMLWCMGALVMSPDHCLFHISAVVGSYALYCASAALYATAKDHQSRERLQILHGHWTRQPPASVLRGDDLPRFIS